MVVAATQANGGNSKIDLRCKACVQAYLVAAGVQAFIEGGEIEKPQVNGFFHLIGIIAGEEYIGNVGVHGHDIPAGVGICGRLEQCVQHLLIGHDVHCNSNVCDGVDKIIY